MTDLIKKEFPDLVKKHGRENVAKSVAVVMLVEQNAPVDDVVKTTGLPKQYVETLARVHRILREK